MNAVTLPTSLEQIVRLQDAMLQATGKPLGDTDDVCPVTHHFAPGMYAREMFIPKGTVIVGKMHRHAHLSSVTKGRILVATEHGNREVSAPAVFVSEAGVKRAGYALEDTIWVTYHATEGTDLAEIEAELIVPESEVLEMVKRKELQ